jgi:hypothetical protein
MQVAKTRVGGRKGDMTTNIINVTPHDVKIVDDTGAVVEVFPASGFAIRLASETKQIGTVAGVPLTSTVYGEPVLITPDGEQVALPAQEEGKFFIVSAMVKTALSGRTDLLVPAEQVRDDQGRVIECKSLGI